MGAGRGIICLEYILLAKSPLDSHNPLAFKGRHIVKSGVLDLPQCIRGQSVNGKRQLTACTP